MILLDTHVCLWLLAAPDRIGPLATEAIRSAPVAYFSAITVVETSIKRMIGRLDVPADLPTHLGAAGLTGLALTHQHALTLESIPELARHDPFDRLLLAQARAEGARLVTADERLLAVGQDAVVDARV